MEDVVVDHSARRSMFVGGFGHSTAVRDFSARRTMSVLGPGNSTTTDAKPQMRDKVLHLLVVKTKQYHVKVKTPHASE